MAKRSGGGASRAQRKHARARQRHAEARGLSHVPTRAEASVDPLADALDEAEEHAPARARRKLPLPAKIGAFLLLLFGAIWFAAQLRQGGAE